MIRLLIAIVWIAASLLGCNDAKKQREASAAFVLKMGIDAKTVVCDGGGDFEPMFCNGVLSGRAVRFICGEDGCSWWDR